MRKVWLSFITIAALTVVVALPAAAATPSCNNSLNWSAISGPALTQPTVPSIPGNIAPVVPVKGNTDSNTQCPKLDINNIIQQLQAQFKNLSGLFGNANCPNQL